MAEPAIKGLEIAAEQIADSLKSLAGRSVALFGHSMGALLAFETARCCDQLSDLKISRLFVSACPAPSSDVFNTIRAFDDASIIRDLREIGGTPAELIEEQEMRTLMLKSLRADYQLLNSYKPRVPIATQLPLVAVGGSEDSTVDHSELSKWRMHTLANFEEALFPGGHFYLAQNVPSISNLIRRCSAF